MRLIGWLRLTRLLATAAFMLTACGGGGGGGGGTPPQPEEFALGMAPTVVEDASATPLPLLPTCVRTSTTQYIHDVANALVTRCMAMGVACALHVHCDGARTFTHVSRGTSSSSSTGGDDMVWLQ